MQKFCLYFRADFRPEHGLKLSVAEPFLLSGALLPFIFNGSGYVPLTSAEVMAKLYKLKDGRLELPPDE